MRWGWLVALVLTGWSCGCGGAVEAPESPAQLELERCLMAVGCFRSVKTGDCPTEGAGGLGAEVTADGQIVPWCCPSRAPMVQCPAAPPLQFGFE